MTIMDANPNLICVTASYFSQVDARSKHYLIETEDNKDDTAGERFDAATLNRKADLTDPCNRDECIKWCRKMGDER